MKTISKAALLILGVSILYLLFSGNFFSLSPIVIAAQVLAVALSVWARRSFQSGQFSIHEEPADGAMLQTGPYHYIRHPMYAAALLLIWSSVFGHLSLITVSIGLVVTAVIAIRIVTEDRFLRLQFPGYSEYANTTKRVIPFLI